MGRRLALVASDFVISFMCVWSSVLIKIFVHNIMTFGRDDVQGEILKHALAVINMFFFAFLVKATKCETYNPLTIFSSAISGNFTQFLFILCARIPAQMKICLLWKGIGSLFLFSLFFFLNFVLIYRAIVPQHKQVELM
ncbi:unnamed protein product [Coffea canephora]|uniref:Uncharacterized protein n=1 Tax=Coffea canephora TaxID=49390 RepID=A0A068UG83_COFCA|nr:unnamed protein product [Coffea canephora]